MIKRKKLTIGLFGFGVVGEGIYRVINSTSTLNASIKKICIKDPGKERNADAGLFTADMDALLNDPDINLIVELIDDADEALKIVSKAMINKKDVVSANKKMIAENLNLLLRLQEEHKVAILYEAAVCGSIPVIRNLEEYYDNDMLKSICGIVNGSTNYILTRMNDEGCMYTEALAEAQAKGFAERNPELDVSGRDGVNKLTILLLHAYGIISSPDEILYSGIEKIVKEDAVYALEKGYKIKLIARAIKMNEDKIAALVLPHFVDGNSQLYSVRDEYNGVVIESRLADKQFLYGKGAGRYPTSSAVLSDIAALGYDYRYEYRKLNSQACRITHHFYLRIYVSFNHVNDVNKWDFEWVEAFHSTEGRQYLIGVIDFEKLKEVSWKDCDDVSIILMPDAVVEREVVVKKKIRQLSMQLAGG